MTMTTMTMTTKTTTSKDNNDGQWQGGSFNGSGNGRRQGGGVKKRCNNQIDYDKDKKGRSKESGGPIQGLVGCCCICHGAVAKKTAGGGWEVPLTTASELLLSVSASSPKGARPDWEYKLKDFRMLKACVKWLRNIGRGVNWDKHMADYRRKIIEVISLEISGLLLTRMHRH